MTDNRLTQKQFDILSFIRSFAAAQGYAPTHREIGAHFGIRSTNAVADHLAALERKGAITRSPLRARTIRVVENFWDANEKFWLAPRFRSGGA